MSDITYCSNGNCPFEDCYRHLVNLKNVEDKTRMVSIANLDSTCEKYICHVLEEIVNGR